MATDISMFVNVPQGDSNGWDTPLKTALTAIRNTADAALAAAADAAALTTGTLDPARIAAGSLATNKINATGAAVGRVLTITGTDTVGWAVPPSASTIGLSVRRITLTTGTFVAGDANNIVEYDNVAAGKISLPLANLYSNTEATLIEVSQVNTGQAEIGLPTAGPTSLNDIIASSGLKSRAQGSSISLRRRVGITVPAFPTTGLLAAWDANNITGVADGGVVASVPESSGVAGIGALTQDVAINQPTLRLSGANGNKGIFFSGNNSNRWLNMSGGALNLARNKSSLMVCVVYETNASITGTRTLAYLSTGTSATASRLTLQQRDNAAGNTQIIGRRLDADTVLNVSAGLASFPDLTAFTARFNWGTASASTYRNTNTAITTRTDFHTAGPTSDTASLIGRVGAAGNDADLQPFFGTIYGVFFYNDDATVLSAFNAYARARWGSQWVVSGDTVV